MEDSKNIAKNNNVSSNPKKHKKKVKAKFHYKNLMLICLALLLFIYSAFITIVPSIITNTFNVKQFNTDFYDATSLITELGSFNYSIKPNMHALIELNNINIKWIGNQEIFDAKRIEIETKNPLAVVTRNFDIESVKVTNAHYTDQMVADAKTNNLVNKLNVITQAFNPEKLGSKKITLKPGYVTVKNYQVSYVTPASYKEDIISNKIYSKADVMNFLREHPVNNIEVK